jgi:precorrin-6B methylase 2
MLTQALKRIVASARLTRFGTETMRNLIRDSRYGGYCGGIVLSPQAHLGAFKTDSIYYSHLDKLFRAAGISIQPSDVLVDIGCGKGRVINYWLDLGQGNKIIGIEYNEQVATWTRNRLKSRHNVHLVTGDAVEHVPADATLLFLNNPFDAAVMQRFKDRLDEVFRDRPVTILYYNALCIDVFRKDSNWILTELRKDRTGLRYTGYVMRNRPRQVAGSGSAA